MSAAYAGNVTPKGLRFLWEIKNYSTLNVATGTAICSPVFFTAHSNNKTLQWRLKLYPNGEDDKDYIAIYIENMNKFGLVLKYSLSIMNDLNVEVFRYDHNPSANAPTIQAFRGLGWSKFEKKSTLMDIRYRTLMNDTFLISFCILSVDSPLDGYDIDEDGTAASKYNKQLFETGNHSDITFSIEDKELHLHKVIVASVSPVFEAMLNNDVKENNENLVVITDIKYDIMKELFRYIYTRNVNIIDKIASELLVAADKYGVAGLKMICEVSLGSTLNDENALQRLRLAVMHNTSYLKPKVIEFVAGKLKTFVRKPEFKDLTHDCKDEILNALANK